jgi:ABC-type Fe3+ transport system permease subunit
MESPYLPPASPETPDPDRARKRRFWKRMIWAAAIGLLLPPVIGVAGTVIGMLRAFSELAATGGADPEQLAKPIATSLLATLFGLLFCVPSGIVLILSIIRFRACAPLAAKERPTDSKPPITSP